MRTYVTTTFDLQSGMISVSVQHPDSGLSLRVVEDVVRQLSAEDQQGLHYAAAHYVQNWQRYERSLKPQG